MPQKSRNREQGFKLYWVSSLGLNLVVCLAIGLGLGLYLDRLTNNDSLFTVIFTLLGIAAGFWQVIKEILKLDASSKRKNPL